MYNITFNNSTEADNYQSMSMYINLSSIVGDPKLISGGGSSGKYIWLQFRGRKTNYQRIIIAIPDSGFGSNPQYIHNDRYWKIDFRLFFPLAKYIEGGVANRDVLSWKLFGYAVLPANETYDIYFYYDSSASIQPYDINGDIISGVTALGKQAVLNVNQKATWEYNTSSSEFEIVEPDPNQPNVVYSEYNKNDNSFQYMGSVGKPRNTSSNLVGNIDNRDAQYGVQTWTPDYND